ncbi:unnamed protein product, partial [Durusdinium trenchii]
DKLLTQLAEDVGLHARSPHSPQLPQDKPQPIAAKVKELLKKLIDNGVGHMKQSDAQQLEAIEFRNYIESDDGDKRSKTVLDDVLSCLQSAIDLCLIAADEFGKQGDQDYMDQLGGAMRSTYKYCLSHFLEFIFRADDKSISVNGKSFRIYSALRFELFTFFMKTHLDMA